jgi:8-oxo-dGTP pyrophosphatase MutT (NUDIX family)
MSVWKTDSSEVVHETPWFKIRQDKVLNHNSKPMTMTYMELRHPSVSIIATDSEGRILLQRSYRYNIKQTVWEIPAGHSDGQDLLVAAKRELQEETGLASDDWEDLGMFYIAPGVANIQQKYFLARNVRPIEGERDEDEEITEQRFFTIEEIEAMLASNEINSYMAPIGVYLAKIHGLKGEK